MPRIDRLVWKSRVGGRDLFWFDLPAGDAPPNLRVHLAAGPLTVAELTELRDSLNELFALLEPQTQTKNLV